jgi:hypothetical protein
MWFWFLWLLSHLGLSGALTAWSLIELAVALGTMAYVILQCVGLTLLGVKWHFEERNLKFDPVLPPPPPVKFMETTRLYRRRRRDRTDRKFNRGGLDPDARDDLRDLVRSAKK